MRVRTYCGAARAARSFEALGVRGSWRAADRPGTLFALENRTSEANSEHDMQLSALDLRKGTLVNSGGKVCAVIYWNIWKSDRRSRVQMKLKDIVTGRVSEVTAQGDDKYEVLESERVQLSHSYRDGNDEVFYTPEGDEFRCTAAAVEDVIRWKADAYEGLLIDGKLLTVNPPQSVVATVVDTTPPIKGVLQGLKDAVLDNGMTVKVGMVIKINDRVRVDTETMEYKERVND
jgi:elongation factor P